MAPNLILVESVAVPESGDLEKQPEAVIKSQPTAVTDETSSADTTVANAVVATSEETVAVVTQEGDALTFAEEIIPDAQIGFLGSEYKAMFSLSCMWAGADEDVVSSALYDGHDDGAVSSQTRVYKQESASVKVGLYCEPEAMGRSSNYKARTEFFQKSQGFIITCSNDTGKAFWGKGEKNLVARRVFESMRYFSADPKKSRKVPVVIVCMSSTSDLEPHPQLIKFAKKIDAVLIVVETAKLASKETEEFKLFSRLVDDVGRAIIAGKPNVLDCAPPPSAEMLQKLAQKKKNESFAGQLKSVFSSVRRAVAPVS